MRNSGIFNKFKDSKGVIFCAQCKVAFLEEIPENIVNSYEDFIFL